jgi:ABC-2 type transport system permease protein
MSTDLQPQTSTPNALATHRLTFAGVLRSEWVKFSSTTATWVTLLLAGLLMVGIAAVAAASSTGAVEAPQGSPAGGLDGADPLTLVLAGQTLVVLLMGVLGAIVGAREYGNGLARTTYAGVPRRWPVLVARVLVVGTAAAAVLAVGTVAAFFVGTAVLDASDAAGVAWSDEGVPRAVLGTAAYLAGTAVLGVCLGTLTRGVGAGIGAVIALVLVIPNIGRLVLPDGWTDAIAYLPSEAAASVTVLEPASDALGTGAGALVFACWVLGALALAVAGVLRRDV